MIKVKIQYFYKIIHYIIEIYKIVNHKKFIIYLYKIIIKIKMIKINQKIEYNK